MAGVELGGPVLELRSVSKRYRGTVALDGIDLAIGSGEVFGLLGPNGAGKTTAVKIVLGLTHPTSGDGQLGGHPFGDPRARRSVGYLPELFRFQGWLTGREVLGLHLELSDLPSAGWAAEIDAALRAADLAARADDRVGTYSKGMQQRLGLAAALMGAPRLVVLDEPGTALDPIGRQELRATIRAARDRGAAVLLNSHQLSEVELVCDRVAILDRGRVQVTGALADLLTPGGVRIRATGIDEPLRSRLASFGPLTDQEGWLVLAGVDQAVVPQIVRLLTSGGAAVYGVELLQPSLEERFIQLLGGDRR